MVGSGIGGDSVADIRVTATATFRFGDVRETREKKTETPPRKEVEEKKPPEEIKKKEDRDFLIRAMEGYKVLGFCEGVSFVIGQLEKEIEG